MFSKLTRPNADRKTGSDKVSVPREDFTSWLELLQIEKEAEALTKKYEERKQYLAYVEQRIKELKENIKETDKSCYSYELFFKDRESKAHMHRTQVETRHMQENEEKIERLRKEKAEMSERKQNLLRQLERRSVFKDFMQKVLQLSQFKDVDELISHLENLLHTRDKLFERRNQVEEQTEEQRKTLQTLEDQHDLLLLQNNNQLSQLQTKLDQTRSETLTWERKWEHIQETAAKKTAELGQIKMAALSLFELTGGVAGPEGVNITDTETQLDQIRIHMEDLNDIIKQYQISVSEQNSNGQKQNNAQQEKSRG